MTFAEARALSEYPNPEVYFEAVVERRRKERLDYLIDTALAVRAASSSKEGFRDWITRLESERSRRPDEKQNVTLFDRLRGERKETLFDRLKGNKRWA